jgi:ferritin-like protein
MKATIFWDITPCSPLKIPEDGKKVKLSLYHAVKAHNGVRGQGSHIF